MNILINCLKLLNIVVVNLGIFILVYLVLSHPR